MVEMECSTGGPCSGIQGLGKTVQSITVCTLKFGPPSQADQADHYDKPSTAGTEEEGPQVHS